MKIQKKKSSKGITLVALVITVIIIIILSAVAINFAFGNNGLIRRAEEAGAMYLNDTEKTEGSITNVEAYINEILGDGKTEEGETDEEEPSVEPEEPEDEFTPAQTPEPPTGGTPMEDMTNGVIEIKWLSGTTNNVSEEPNGPIIKTDMPAGTSMEQVVFNGTSWVSGTEYSYVPGQGSNDNTSSEWANARVITQVNGQNIESYFVWIPRYAYRIIYFNNADSKKAYQEGTLTEETAVASGQIIGYSDSRGIVDAQGRKITDITSPSNSPKTMVCEDYFMVHPAFTTDENVGGGWDNELAGLWIGKYEAACTDTVGDSYGEANTIKTQAGVRALTGVTIGQMYSNAINYLPELQSHMLKNSEWGAVAYLTESKYGRNGTEVAFNGSDYITGGGLNNSFVTNVAQSSTGNVYGIYDLRGSSFEYTASYYNGADVDTVALAYGEPFAQLNKTSDRFSTVYTAGTRSGTADEHYIYGDATFETGEWHEDDNSFITDSDPFFERSGNCQNSERYAGIFYSDSSDGSEWVNNGFRVAIIV